MAAGQYFVEECNLLRTAAQLFLAALFSLASMQVVADTYSYQAISDFDDIAAGEVPYYVDTVEGRNVLAIDAAIADFREKFARATTMFTGDSGIFDVSITTLGEIDGEGEFRFLVNGEVVGSGINDAVDEDWGEQVHVFENIEIVSGDEIGVESDARSNGLIPENGEYAFARGRWRELELIADDAATANPVSVNLSIAVAAQPEQAELGDIVATVITVINRGENTATNPVIQVRAGEGLQFISGDGCSSQDTGNVVSCALQEVESFSTAASGLAFAAIGTGNTTIAVEVMTDQTDTDLADNVAQIELEVITGDNLQTVTSAVVSGASTATDGESDDVLMTAQGAAATGSSGGSGAPSILLHLVLVIGLALRCGLLSRCRAEH